MALTGVSVASRPACLQVLLKHFEEELLTGQVVSKQIVHARMPDHKHLVGNQVLHKKSFLRVHLAQRLCKPLTVHHSLSQMLLSMVELSNLSRIGSS